MADFSGVTASVSPTTVSTGSVITASISGSAVVTSASTSTVTLTLTAADGSTSTLTAPNVTVNKSAPSATKITAVTDSLGHVWTIAADGQSATATA
jgi:hypothetical protein